MTRPGIETRSPGLLVNTPNHFANGPVNREYKHVDIYLRGQSAGVVEYANCISSEG